MQTSVARVEFDIFLLDSRFQYILVVKKESCIQLHLTTVFLPTSFSLALQYHASFLFGNALLLQEFYDVTNGKAFFLKDVMNLSDDFLATHERETFSVVFT